VLGQHLAGGEQAVFAQLALGNDAFALLEQVGQDALVGDGNVLGGVGDDEAHRQAVGLRCRLASLTMPPMRKVLPMGAFPPPPASA
jgi:hypothetical protein